MMTRQAKVLAVSFGVAIAVVLTTALALSSSPRVNTEVGTTMASVLWMHALAPSSSGTERWYNFTLTVNQTIPLADLLFEVSNQSGVFVFPSTFGLALMKLSLPIAEYNFSAHNWTSGVSGAVVAGDWLEVQVANANLAGDRLVAFAGGGPFSSTCAVAIP